MSTHLLFTVELPLEPDFDGVYRSGSSPSWLLLLDGVFGVASTASSNNIDDNLFFFGETERFKDIGDLAGVGGGVLERDLDSDLLLWSDRAASSKAFC